MSICRPEPHEFVRQETINVDRATHKEHHNSSVRSRRSFFLNVGLAVVLKQALTTPFFLELRLQYFLNSRLGLHPHNNIGGFLASFMLALTLAVMSFVCLRLLLLDRDASPVKQQ